MLGLDPLRNVSRLWAIEGDSNHQYRPGVLARTVRAREKEAGGGVHLGVGDCAEGRLFALSRS